MLPLLALVNGTRLSRWFYIARSRVPRAHELLMSTIQVPELLKKAKISDQLWGVLSSARPGPPHLAHAHAPHLAHPRMYVYDQL